MKLALCIGINDYPGTENDLSGCRNDAEDWAGILEQRGFDTRRLLDSAATGDAIRSSVRELLAVAQPGDTAVVTYSGHGTWVPDDNGDEADQRDEALCPYDVFTNGPIIDDELYTLFAPARTGVRVVLVSDSCHAGTLTRFAAPLGDSRRRTRFLAPETFLSGSQRAAAATIPPAYSGKPRSSALLLAGCRDREYSYDATFGGRPNGAFTYVALQALHGLADGADYRTWMKAIRAQLPSQNYPQTPGLQGTAIQQSWPALA